MMRLLIGLNQHLFQMPIGCLAFSGGLSAVVTLQKFFLLIEFGSFQVYLYKTVQVSPCKDQLILQVCKQLFYH